MYRWEAFCLTASGERKSKWLQSTLIDDILKEMVQTKEQKTYPSSRYQTLLKPSQEVLKTGKYLKNKQTDK